MPLTSKPKYSTAFLIKRSLKPSAVSLFFCVVIAVAMVVSNIVLQSVDAGTALPGLLDGQWAIAYTDHVVQPLTQLLNSNTLNKLLIAALWGLAGFIVYIAFEYLLHSAKALRESRSNIRIARGNVVQHPMVESFWQSVWWRIGVIIAGIVFLIAVQPLLNNALGVADRVLFNDDLMADGLRVALAAAEWVVVLHGVVVFLRLYTMRTRLFGDDELY
jgi:hypothetical protein